MTWILPKNLRTSAFATDTAELTSDLTLQQVDESGLSLFARSKPLQSKMLLRKWKRGELRRLRSGLILKPSLGKVFEERWTSSLEDIVVNHSAQQESDLEIKTPAIFGLTSQLELVFCDPPSASLKTSKGTYRWDSPRLSAIWKKWVMRCRGEYSARLKSARLTRESGCSSWPTVTVAEGGKIGCQANYGQKALSNHPAIVGQPDRAKLNKSGRNRGLCENWRTPDVSDRRSDKSTQIGLSNQAKQWATPRAGKTTDEDPEVWAKRKANGDVATMPLGAQVKNWATPCSRDHHPNGEAAGSKTDLGNQVARNWGAPRTSMAQDKQEDSGKHKLGEMAQNNSGKKLNSKWVCQLMGVPTDWVYPSESERNRTDELRMLGNGVVPQTAAKAFVTLLTQ